ncbi:MAG: class I SAM-dependent methyltransferase [Planctomycetota bacterium]|nr:MAG: class I SAM-dependent methyltransferase [Planctomycetota bacterium]
MTLWLPAHRAPELGERVAWWRAREEALRRHGPLRLLRAGPSPRTPGIHRRLEAWLPFGTWREDVYEALRAWFGPALEELGVRLERGALAHARSWVDARAWLPPLGVHRFPSEALAALDEPEAAHELLFALYAPPRWGAALGRYPDRLARLVEALAGRRRLRAWDVGCATGEGTWEFAAALGAHRSLEVVGSTPWPLERLMAERGVRPHDPAASAALASFRRAHAEDLAGACVRFVVHDLRAGPLPGAFDAVLCHGLLGGLLRGADAERAFAHLAGALAPGALLSVADRFREDRARTARAQVRASAERAGLEELEPGLYRRPIPGPRGATAQGRSGRSGPAK